MVPVTPIVDVFADYAKTIARRYKVGRPPYGLTAQDMGVLHRDGAGVGHRPRR